MNVLIVDDDLGFLELVQRVVEDALEGPKTVTLAYTGDGGMAAIANTETIDVAILDVNLPGPSGIKVSQRLRAKNGQALIVLLTGTVPVDDPMLSQAGADLVLPKVGFIDDLIRAIEERLRRA